MTEVTKITFDDADWCVAPDLEPIRVVGVKVSVSTNNGRTWQKVTLREEGQVFYMDGPGVGMLWLGHNPPR